MLPNFYQTELLEAGCDEAGRGCLAGPVFAAAVILPPDFHHPLLNDSKQMTEKNRNLLREIICREAVAWAVEAVSAERIDQINILNASFEGMSLAASRLLLFYPPGGNGTDCHGLHSKSRNDKVEGAEGTTRGILRYAQDDGE